MKTLSSFSVQNGSVTEQYSVVVDASGETFLQCCVDADNVGPVDTMHIDRHALVPIARALLMATIQQPQRPLVNISDSDRGRPAAPGGNSGRYDLELIQSDSSTPNDVPVGNVVPFRVIA